MKQTRPSLDDKRPTHLVGDYGDVHIPKAPGVTRSKHSGLLRGGIGISELLEVRNLPPVEVPPCLNRRQYLDIVQNSLSD